jgi:hypothetical protein
MNMQKFFHCGNHYFDKLTKETNTRFCKDTFTALSRYIKLIAIENNSFGKHHFYNNNILFGSKNVYLKFWFDAGVYKIEHLIAPDGKVLFYNEIY